MESQKIKPKTIDAYISAWPVNIQELLQQVRTAIRENAPTASETISYGIPTFTLNGNLVHFAAFKNHIGFYPGPSGIEAFPNQLSTYVSAKGSVQFPYDRPLPLELISKIVKYRVKENKAKGK